MMAGLLDGGSRRGLPRRQIIAIAIGVVLVSTTFLLRWPQRIAATPPAVLPGHLAGVNLGGWLCLEDWFYSGDRGLHVSTVDEDGQGRCLPPVLDHMPWRSEGNLTYELNKSKGTNFTIKAFAAHRHSFIGESDLVAIASLNLRMVRLPITWAAFAEALAPLDRKMYASHNPATDTTVVADPFYSDRAMVTIPRAWLEELLLRASRHGLQVLLDLHAFPGGSSDGTYNGVWPHAPAFWRNTSRVGQAKLTDVGLWVVGACVGWLEGLPPEAKAGLLGLTVMNEPAHLNSQKHFAEEQQVLNWLTEAAQVFRASKLPQEGKKLYMQMIDTAFQDPSSTMLPWFLQTFSVAERGSWVVADQHWYTAWDEKCAMRTDEAGLRCDMPIETIRTKMRSCASAFAQDFQQQYGMQMAVSEFSVGSHEEAKFACRDREVLMAFLQEQLSAWDAVGMQGFFWTWRMPYGKIFEPGWSLRWLAGLEDTAQLPCG